MPCELKNLEYINIHYCVIHFIAQNILPAHLRSFQLSVDFFCYL